MMHEYDDAVIDVEPPDAEVVFKLKKRVHQLEEIMAMMYLNIGTKDEREDYMTADELATQHRWDGTYPTVKFTRGFDTAAIRSDIAYHGKCWDL